MSPIFLCFPILWGAQDVSYGVGTWDKEKLGNHRAVVRVAEAVDAVRVHVPWRRRDRDAVEKNVILVDGTNGERVTNVARVNVNREFGELAFQPVSGAGDYFLYYLPYVTSGRGAYPTVVYQKPEETAEPEWLKRHRLTPEDLASGHWRELPAATVVEIQACDELNSFWPMEVTATSAEMAALVTEHQTEPFLLYPEDRAFPIRMTDDLPLRWIESGPGRALQGTASRGEFYAFQVGVFAHISRVDGLRVVFSDLLGDGGNVIPAAVMRCLNLGGVDSAGVHFEKTISVEQGKVQALWFGVDIGEEAPAGLYQGHVEVAAEGVASRRVAIEVEVADHKIAAAGDDEPWRHSRLRWLDSRIGFDDEIVAPFTPVTWDGFPTPDAWDGLNRLGVLGREVTLDERGLPREIASFFAPEMTHRTDRPRAILARGVRLVVEAADGTELDWSQARSTMKGLYPGAVKWRNSNRVGGLDIDIHGRLEFDGTLEYEVAVRARERMELGDIRLELPIAANVARYMLGMGRKGGFCPDEFEWRWNVRRNQDGAWIGDVNAGLQFSMRDESYVRPLNTNFYQSKPLVIPRSWDNSGRGGCKMERRGDTEFLVTCFSGPRTMQAGESLRYDFRLAITPFKPIDPRAHFGTRYYHRFNPLEEIAATGANTINVHHATPINPFINYPFLRPDEMKAYIDEAHARDLKVKIYYTVRELTNRAAELFALRSLGDEVLSNGPGGGFSWLQEHLGGDYIAGWLVPSLEDAAVINSGVSRWHNYYLEGLDWLARNIGVDGLYIDDVAFDRVTMKRVRKILDRRRPGALIDLHSANQFNERDGFANSANLYLEHFPYLDRLWFGEYFDYDSPPEFWMTEMAGIPFGLMGEMLQDGGNPWRGMLYGMTGRLPWAGDPRPLWQAWDEFGIVDARMIGYWVPDAPVQTSHDAVLATTYMREGKALVAIASWAPEEVEVDLYINWEVLGIDREQARITGPEIESFQDALRLAPDQKLRVPPGRGFLLVIES